MKIRPARAKILHVDVETDRRTDMTKLKPLYSILLIQKAQRFAGHLEYILQLRGKEEEKEMIIEDIVQQNEVVKLVTATYVNNEINKNITPPPKKKK